MVVCRKLLQNCVLRRLKKDPANAESIMGGSMRTVPGTVHVFYGAKYFYIIIIKLTIFKGE
jgi:hypothetical protein